MYYLVYDTESTGLERIAGSMKQPRSVVKSGSEIIQIGGLFLSPTMQPMKAFCHYCDVLATHSDAKAFSVHQIHLEDIRAHLSGVFLEEVLMRWVPQVFADDILFIGYNTDFDMRMTRQCVRDFPVEFKLGKRALKAIPRSGRYELDVMDFLGTYKVPLASFADELKDDYQEFMSLYKKALIVESNIPELYRAEGDHAHSALYDVIQTYLLFMRKVWGVKIFARGGSIG